MNYNTALATTSFRHMVSDTRASHPDIASLVPHAGAMCLLGRVEHWNEHRIACRATSHHDPTNPLRTAHGLPVRAGIEYAAQAVAAHGSLLARRSGLGDVPRQGMIAVLTDVRWQAEFLDQQSGDLQILAVRLGELPDGLQYQFTVLAGTEVLVEGELLIALSAKPSA